MVGKKPTMYSTWVVHNFDMIGGEIRVANTIDKNKMSITAYTFKGVFDWKAESKIVIFSQLEKRNKN